MFHRCCSSLFFVEPIYTALFEQTAKETAEEGKKKKKRNDRVLRVPPVFYFLSIVSPSLFSIRLFLLFYPQRAVLTPSHSISDCFLSLNHCSFLIVLVRVGEVPSAREVEEECARMERNRGNWGVMRTT